jgi:hypothetical protein
MSKPAIRIDAISVQDLTAFAQHTQGEPGIVPITLRRALSHAANPHARPEEVALLAAYKGERCIGFLGLMAGALLVNGEARRMHWFSSWYVDPEDATSGAGAMLLMRAIGLKYDLAVTGTSREADDMYRATRFTEIGPLKYEEVFLDALDPLGFPFFAFGKWLERRGKSADAWYAIARAVKPVLHPVIKKAVYYLCKPLLDSRTTVATMDEFQAPTTRASGTRFYRNPETVNWMLQHPWFTENESEAVDGYYFGDYRPTFRYRVYRFERGGECIGMMVVSASKKNGQTTVKLLDHWYADDDAASNIVQQTIAFAGIHGADRILLPHEFRDQLRRITLLGRLTFTRTRNYFCRPKKKDSVLAPVLGAVELQLTDGDCAFS